MADRLPDVRETFEPGFQRRCAVTRRNRCRLWGIFLVLVAVVAAPSEGRGWRWDRDADFSTVVFVGDSLTAGFQNGGLSVEGQTHGYAALIAQQAGFDIALPLVSEPGIPPKLLLESLDPLVVAPADGPGVRLNPREQATNLAVPGHTVADALSKRATDDVLTFVVLGEPGISEGKALTQVEWAEELGPTFVFLWIGSNDFLGYAISGGTRPLTDVKAFASHFRDLLGRLEATGAGLVVANIPEVTAIPFLIEAGKLAGRFDQDLTAIGPILGIRDGDYVTLDGVAAAEKMLLGLEPGPLPDAMVLDAAEARRARRAVDRANRFIERQARRRNFPVVDVHLLFRYLSYFGVPLDGKLLTTGYLGGLFSLDGIHPTRTGHALLANHFIRTLNRRYRAGIPRIRIGPIAESDPLVIPELLPDTREVLKNLLRGVKGDSVRPLRDVLEGRFGMGWRRPTD
jgi:lysophospholipase L1-like esterase